MLRRRMLTKGRGDGREDKAKRKPSMARWPILYVCIGAGITNTTLLLKTPRRDIYGNICLI